ncbi:uncharacterized protein HD556DRAFT_1526312 [Suillus plorans]|uniref:Fungal-type protein kinase domain-containing protein n=1 Tax=Suillus plorans TaxID=116603 RepID=A0A9P7ATE2_9AGAM|nr:uncharacterized protein HD556DRAFT_1526312 [Suillus plorans]KAG1796268.1 hypothetical protein HD556DRAFT_1526312 [Suillus plorans]
MDQCEIEQAKECNADAMLQAFLQRASSTLETKQPDLLPRCLKAVLPVCNGQASTALVKSSDVATALNEYPAAVLSLGFTAAQPSSGGSSSKRKVTDTLESATKKSKMNPDDTDADLDVTVQTGLYAAEIFAANLGVNYLNIIVVDDVIWTWYYDRQGTVQSSGINVIQDLPRFMVLLCALRRFKDKELGRVDLLLHSSHDDRVTYYGPQGRVTNLVAITSEALMKKYGNLRDGMVAKIFLGKVNRTSESEILKKVQDHVPELLWHHTFTNPASVIREVLGVPDSTTGSRVLYILLERVNKAK